MGRNANYPTTINDLRTFDISFLSKHKYFTPNQTETGTITWTSSHGDKNSIGIKVRINKTNGILTVDYTFRNTEKINYNIELITRPSNLGTGLLWFFVCPFTGKVCRKLHLINGYFKHRSALLGLMYQCQIEPKKWRKWSKTFDTDNLYSEMYSKNFKKFYAGKMTKRYSRICKKIEQSENIDMPEFYNLFRI